MNKKILKFFKKRKIITLLLILILGISFYFAYIRKENAGQKYSFAEVKKQTLRQIVSLTGKVISENKVGLSFEQIGKLQKIFVKAGDKVKQNQILAEQNHSQLSAELARSLASLENSQSVRVQLENAREYQMQKLRELTVGSRSEEIEILKTEVKNSQNELEQLYFDTPRILQYSYILSDDAVKNKTSSMFIGSESSSYTLSYSSCSRATETEAENLRLISEKELKRWQGSLQNISLHDTLLLENILRSSTEFFPTFYNFFQKTNDTLVLGCVINNESLDAFRAQISAARASLNTALSSLNSQIEKISTQKIIIEKKQNELSLKAAGATREQIAAQEFVVKQSEANISAQEAVIKQARAGVANISSQIAKTMLRAPISGTVTKVDAKSGEVILSNTPLISLISDEMLEIEAFIPEVDIAKIETGDMAEITLDAYGDETKFIAEVFFLDPAETIIDNVPTYKIRLKFQEKDLRIKSGMTADIEILTEKIENALAVPQRAIFTKNGEKYVRVITGQNSEEKTVSEKKVKTGLAGSDGMIEILAGIIEGEKIITFMKE